MLENDIAGKLIQHIVDNNLKAGSKLPSIREFATMWECNPSQVRTGLITLSAMGIVDMHSRAGSFVKQLSSGDMDTLFVLFFRLGMIGKHGDTINLYEVKRLLDKEIFCNAAKYRTDRDLIELELILERQRALLSDTKPFVLIDEEFHVRLAQIIRNPLIEFLIGAIQGMIRPYRLENFTPQICRESYDGHLRIFDAVRDHNEAEAEKLAVGHATLRLQRLAMARTGTAENV
ncbi:MAG: FCD domain-containing protein [Treponemataceae bacterium]